MTPYLNVAMDDESQVGFARREAAKLAAALGLDEVRRGRVALVVTELANNLVRHAKGGRLLLGATGGNVARSFEVLALDRGPGMADVNACLQDGHSSTGTPGTGLGAARRLADEFSVFSALGKGTVVAARVGTSRDVPSAALPFSFSGICLAAPGESESGDGWDLRLAEGKVKVIVADGLGHGPVAAEASSAATRVFADVEGPPSVVLEQAHRTLATTRGAAVAMAELDASRATVTFAGAGNVIGRIVSGVEDRSLLSQHGTIGLQIRRIKDVACPWPEHALFVLHSDGITSRWSLADVGDLLRCDAAVIAGWIIRDHCRGRDDVTVVVIKRGNR